MSSNERDAAFFQPPPRVEGETERRAEEPAAAAGNEDARAAGLPAIVSDAVVEPVSDDSLNPAAASSSTLFSAAPNNSAEAEDALELGRTLAQSGRDADLPRAERLLAKSVRMRPTTESAQLLAAVQRRRRAAAAAAGAGAAASAAPAGSHSASASVPPTAQQHSHQPPQQHHPPRPQAPPNPVPSVAHDPQPPRASSSLLSWRRCTIEAPSFLQPRAGPGVPIRSWTFAYPSFLYIPRAQRMSLLVIWSMVMALALMRWMNAHTDPVATGRAHQPHHGSHRQSDPSSSAGGGHSGSRTYLRGERFDLYGSADDTQSRYGDSTASSDSAWSNPIPRHNRRTPASSFFFFSPDSLLTLLTLLVFFAPMLTQWMRQMRQEFGPRIRRQFGL